MATNKFFILIIFVMISCQRNINLRITETTETAKIVKGNRFEGVIFSEIMVSNLYKDTIRRFTPTAKEIIMAEEALNEQIESILDYKPRFSKNHYAKLNDFYRQYVGVIQNDEKFIHIYFISHKIIKKLPIKDGELKTEFIHGKTNIQDGYNKYQDDFWNIKYNMKTGKIFDFRYIRPLSWRLM